MMLQFEHPFTCVISGPTCSGKTELTKRFVQHATQLMSTEPEKIYWCYSEWQPGYQELCQKPKMELIEGVPDLLELQCNASVPKLLIMDDLMSHMNTKDDQLNTLFTRGAHHWNCSSIHIVQNLFYGKMRTARINSHYIFLMKNPSDKLQAGQLAKQLYPGQQQFFMQSYKDACSVPYGYLLIDLAPNTEEHLRLRTTIFPDDKDPSIVYLPK